MSRNMNENIQILEKPEWVTWDDVHEVIWKAHETNRAKGMNMAHAALSGKEIEEYLSPKGKMFVAILGEKVIGTAAYRAQNNKFWFGKGEFAYCCFASVLPDYRGEGVYGRLMKLREEVAKSNGIDKMLFNTHPNNTRVIEVALKNGFEKVNYTVGRDSAWVYMVKWLDGTPCSRIRIRAVYLFIKTVRKIKQLLRLFPARSK